MNRRLSSKAVGTASILCLLLMPALLWAATQAADIDQWSNTSNSWQNGNLNETQADYREDDTVAYRAKLTNLIAGHSYTFWIEYDTTVSGKHAIDFLKTYNATEAANPCAGVTCSGSPTTFPIPIDPNVNNSADPHPTLSYLAGDPEYLFTMWGGSISAVGTPVLTNGTFTGGVYSNATSTAMPVTFTASGTSAVLAWGGHVSTHSDWGVGTTAVNVSGSPYHMRLGGVNNSFVDITANETKNLGNQDRSMQISGFASRITIIKHGDPEDSSTLFPFTLAQPGGGKCATSFELAANDSQQLCSRIRHSGSFTITETLDGVNNFKWALTDISCTSVGNPPVTLFTKSALPANAPTDGSVTFSINVDLQQDVTCTFTNKHKPMLTLDKIVNNNYGGDAVPGDFTFNTTGTNVMKFSDGSPVTPNTDLKDGDSVVMDGGSSYNVTEDPIHGYVLASSSNCSGTLNFNNEVTCTLTNNDIQPKLTVIKHVINDNGGSASASEFSMSVSGTNVSQTLFAGTEAPGVTVTLNQGAYSVSENGPMTNYTATLDNCVGSIHVGDEKTCIITNDDIGPKLRIIKNTIGGDASFPIVMTWPEGNANPVIATSGGTGTTGYIETSTGTVSVEEILTGQPAPGWDFSSVACQEDTTPDPTPIAVVPGPAISLSGLLLNHNYTCTFTNTRRALITVKKVTDPANSLQAFGITVNGGTVIGSNQGFISVGSPAVFEVVQGAYSVSETPLAGWDETGSTCGAIVVAPGDQKECTITNTQRGQLVVTKHTNPGSDNSTVFTVTGSGSVLTTATPILGNPVRELVGNLSSTIYDVAGGGTYNVVESPLAGWDQTGEFNCKNVNVAPGTIEYCEITNTQRGHLIVHKTTDPASDTTTAFSITASQTLAATSAPAITGLATRDIFGGTIQNYEVAGDGKYSVSEVAPADWDMTSNDCSDVLVPAGGEAHCYITNTKRGHLIVHKTTDPSSDTTTPFSITASQTAATTNANPITGLATRDIFGGTIQDYEVAGNGTYKVTEAALAGWDMTFNDCSNVVVPAGGEAHCYITNTKRGHLIVHKTTDPASDTTTAFSITAIQTAATTSAPAVTGDATRDIFGGTIQDYEVAGNGTYKVDEAALAGWDMTSNDCVNVVVPAGGEQHCYITNTKRGHLIVHKTTDPASDTTTAFSITAIQTAATTSAPAVTGDATRDIFGGTIQDYEVAGNGTYKVDEAALAGWDMTSNDCVDIVVLAGGEQHCYITNTKRGHLIVHKATNPASDTTTAFSITAIQTAATTSAPAVTGDATRDIFGGTTQDYEVAGNGTYKVDEAALAGWDMTSNDCVDIVVLAGGEQHCYITNTKRGHLKVLKVTDPSSDTTTEFSITADGTVDTGAPLITGDATRAIVGGETEDYEVAGGGTYSVSEADLAGWDETGNTCNDIYVAPGAEETCTITNTQRGHIIVTKHTDPASDTSTEFPVLITGIVPSGAPLVTGEAARVLVGNSGTTNYEVAGGGTYSVDETVPAGWIQTKAEGCSSIVVAPGTTLFCDIYNSAYGHVIVKKFVVNDNGGTAQSANFTMNFTGNQPTLTSFPGSEEGTTVDVLAGEYSVTESGPNGYLGQFSEGCSGTIAAGETKECTITNDDIQPKLVVTKTVINDNGGTAVSGDFLMNVSASGVVGILSFPGEVTGTTIGINAGSYSVTESGPGGYEGTMSGFCVGTIGIGEIRFCDIVNNDIAPKLIVHKTVVNNDGRTKTASDFSVTLNGGSPVAFSGGIVTFDPLTVGVPYTVTEVAVPGYQPTYTGSCTNVSLALGQEAHCYITNNDIPAGLATNSELCQFDYNTSESGNQFILNFKKDGPKYVLNASNPGQFYYNVINGSNSTTDVTMQIPFPFVTNGAVPVHVYTSFEWIEASRCFKPTGPATAISSEQIVFKTGYNQFGNVASITVPGVPSGAYVNIHLDYGFKDTAGWGKSGSDATKTPWTIENQHEYIFDILGGGAQSKIKNQNKF